MKHLLIAVLAFVTLSAFGQASPHETVKGDNVSITYGRPYMKGRDIFGSSDASLVKYGSVWRLGADQATTITFDKDVKFGDAKLKAGTYTLFAIPGEKEWTFIINSQLGQWGAFSYEKNKDKDVAKIKAPAKKTSAPVEQLTIGLPGSSEMTVEWANTHVSVPIKF